MKDYMYQQKKNQNKENLLDTVKQKQLIKRGSYLQQCNSFVHILSLNMPYNLHLLKDVTGVIDTLTSCQNIVLVK